MEYRIADGLVFGYEVRRVIRKPQVYAVGLFVYCVDPERAEPGRRELHPDHYVRPCGQFFFEFRGGCGRHSHYQKRDDESNSFTHISISFAP